MNDDIAIKVENVSKTFKLPHEKNTTIKGAVVNFYKRNKSYETQQALKDIYFEVKKGEFFGIVGRNGSGKSTLLKLLAGIYTPTKGSITVNGNLTPFIELGVGFNQELSGRENVFLNGALLGFSRKEMYVMYDDIVDFAEIERFMDQKLKNYSSGMQVRLAFSIAIRANGAILLLDEVLAVGDAIFQKKCYNYFKELKKLKKTVILVSHDSNALQQFCDRAILIESGELLTKGKIGTVINEYTDLLNSQEEKTETEKEALKSSDNKERWGNGNILIDKVVVSSGKIHKPRTVFTDKDEILKIEIYYKAQTKCLQPTYGLTITDASGQRFFTSNTVWSNVTTKNVKEGDSIKLQWLIPNIFNTGDYYISPAVSGPGGTYDWRENFINLKIRKSQQSAGLINVEHTITLENVYER